MENKEIADELNVDPSVISRMIDRIRQYPELIADLETELAELRSIYASFLGAKEERKNHTRYGLTARGDFCKGLRIIRKPASGGGSRRPRSSVLADRMGEAVDRQ